jgi:methylated-DNA-[protein]-cysteine S-methyltransferase
MATSYFTEMPSAIGPLTIVGDGDAVTRIHMHDQRHQAPLPPGAVRDDAALAEPRRQLDEYLAGERNAFDLPLRPHGSPFQLAVWEALCQIPYGETISYGELADRVGRPGAARAVGLANGRNPIAIVVPCHRVIGASGSLTGYGGGLERKRFLLELEAGRLALV